MEQWDWRNAATRRHKLRLYLKLEIYPPYPPYPPEERVFPGHGSARKEFETRSRRGMEGWRSRRECRPHFVHRHLTVGKQAQGRGLRRQGS